MRVLILFLRHGTDKYQGALADLGELYLRRASNLTRSTFIIDNALPAGQTEKLSDGTALISGDNTWWEFSGWQRAIDMLGDEIKSYDAVHFVTSAFRTHYTDYLDRFSPEMVEAVAKRPVAAGHIDYYPYPIRFGAYVSRHWIRSSFWLINPVELLRLKDLVTINSRRGLFSMGADWPFADGAPLSRGYQELIHSWLTSSHGTGQNTTWHSRFDITDETRTLFQDKTIAILNEHLLSIRLRAQGTHVLDMTYLAEVIQGGGPLPDSFPGWRTQLRLRGIPGHDNISDVDYR